MEVIRGSIRRSEADVAAESVVSNERVFAELEIMLSLPWLRYSGAEPQSGNFRGYWSMAESSLERQPRTDFIRDCVIFSDCYCPIRKWAV